MDMFDPRGQIVHECKAGLLTWKSIALTYAFAIRQEGITADYSAANAAIKERFKSAKDPDGEKTLAKIKKLAEDYVAGRKKPGQ